jgi:hypothetical protein
MLQVACFRLPDEQDKANEFLKQHKPVGTISFTQDIVFIAYDPDPAAPLLDMLESVRNARFQQEVALYILESELAAINRVRNKGAYEEKDNQIQAVQRAIDTQDTKADFLTKRIKELRASSNN